MGGSESRSAVEVEEGKEEMKKARTTGLLFFMILLLHGFQIRDLRGGYSGSVFALTGAPPGDIIGGCVGILRAIQTSTVSYEASLKSVWEASLHTVKGHGFRVDPIRTHNPTQGFSWVLSTGIVAERDEGEILEMSFHSEKLPDESTKVTVGIIFESKKERELILQEVLKRLQEKVN